MEKNDALDEALELKARGKIYKVIEESPGLHFREIQRRAEIAVGSLQYHLEYLQKKHLVRIEKQGKFVRYYSVRGRQLGEDEKTMSLLRQNTIRRIVLHLLQHKQANNLSISNAVNLSASTVSWHLEKMLEEGLIEREKHGRESIFILKNPDKIAQLVVNYKDSFLDQWVDNFAEMWEKF
ncbi:MAG: winged helix-turn-helix transcriptional regulator [archaeon]|nr:winged helix-turn-helix transcriptional regulator [archaeon]